MVHTRPSVRKRAFDCPHCGAYTGQTWYNIGCRENTDEHPLPRYHDADFNLVIPPSANEAFAKEIKVISNKLKSGKPIRQKTLSDDYIEPFYGQTVENVFASVCFHCDEITLWVHDSIVYPPTSINFIPNPDMPDSVKRDFGEAASIFSLSPRGAAALLRLCVQKICIELGLPGKKINDDIKLLVENGLDPRIQQALDSVRVIGNEAVHPGEMNLDDDRETAAILFELVNLIVERLISMPKRVSDTFAALPKSKRDQIAKRDGKGPDV